MNISVVVGCVFAIVGIALFADKTRSIGKTHKAFRTTLGTFFLLLGFIQMLSGVGLASRGITVTLTTIVTCILTMQLLSIKAKSSNDPAMALEWETTKEKMRLRVKQRGK